MRTYDSAHRIYSLVVVIRIFPFRAMLLGHDQSRLYHSLIDPALGPSRPWRQLWSSELPSKIKFFIRESSVDPNIIRTRLWWWWFGESSKVISQQEATWPTCLLYPQTSQRNVFVAGKANRRSSFYKLYIWENYLVKGSTSQFVVFLALN